MFQEGSINFQLLKEASGSGGLIDKEPGLF